MVKLKTKTMELTGKCKEDFEKWKRRDVFYKNIGIYSLSMRWGVLQDFFHNSGIDIITRWKDTRFISYAAPHEKNDEFYRATEHETRAEARTAAIRKANEIYNNNQ